MSIFQTLTSEVLEFYNIFTNGTPIEVKRTPQQTPMFTEIKYVSVNGIQQQMIQACSAYSEALQNGVSDQELVFLLNTRNQAIQDFYNN